MLLAVKKGLYNIKERTAKLLTRIDKPIPEG